MRKSIARGENLVTGEVTEITKFKEDSNVRGIAFLELTENGETVYKSEAENLFIDYNEWNAWACSHSNAGAFFHSNGPRNVSPYELHLLYDKDNKEDKRFKVRDRTFGTVNTQGEGVIEGWADIRGNYSGNDTIRGSRSQALSYSYIDPATMEMVYRYGFIFDETKLIGKKINKLGLYPRPFMGASASWSNMVTYTSFTGQRAADDAADQMEMRFNGFPKLSDTWQRINNRQLHGDILLNTPDDYKSRSSYAVMWSDTKKVSLTGYVDYKEAVELILGDLDAGNRDNGLFNYRDTSRCMFDPKKRRLYYVSPVVSGDKAFISFFIAMYDVKQAEIDKFPSKRLTPTWTKHYDLNPKHAFNLGSVRPSCFVPYFNWDKDGVLEIIYNSELTGDLVNVRMNTDWTILDRRLMPFFETVHYVDRITEDFYRVCIAKAHTGWKPNFYDERYINGIYFYLDFKTGQSFRGDHIGSSQVHSSYFYFGANDTLTGTWVVFDEDSNNSSRSKIYFPAPIIQRPIEYLYLDRIPEVAKTNLQQLKIVYEIRQKLDRTNDVSGIVDSRETTTEPYVFTYYKNDTWNRNDKGFFKFLHPNTEIGHAISALPKPEFEFITVDKCFILPSVDTLGSWLRIWMDTDYNYNTRLSWYNEIDFGTATESTSATERFTPAFNLQSPDTEIRLEIHEELKSEMVAFGGNTTRDTTGWFDLTNDTRIVYMPTKNLPSSITDMPITVLARAKGSKGEGLPLCWIKVKQLSPVIKTYLHTIRSFVGMTLTGGDIRREISLRGDKRRYDSMLIGQYHDEPLPVKGVITLPINVTTPSKVILHISTFNIADSRGHIKIWFEDELVLTADSTQNKNTTLAIEKVYADKANLTINFEFHNRWTSWRDDFCIRILGLEVVPASAR